MKAEKKMSERPGKMKLQDGFTLMELVIATAIVGIVAAVAVPQFSAYKVRVHDANVQSDLRSIFTACQGFWTFEGSRNPCLLSTLSNSEFGFTPSTDVEVTINSDENNTEYDFYATASHSLSSNIFAVNYKGVVTKITVEGEGEDDDESDDGNKGRGCSEEAHKDPHDLGGNAAGGCGTSSGNNSGSSNGNNSGPSGGNSGNNSGPSGGNNSGPDKWWKKWWK